MIFEEIPTPLQLGLQHRFWRPYQQEAIKRIAESPKKIVILQAPPGIGKSAIALGLLRYLDTKGIILTNTINLQLQYLREGDRIVETVFGRANYPCVLPRYDFDLATQMGVTETTTADNAPCLSGFRCEYKNVCPYYEEKAKAEASPITVLNYSYWLSISRHVGDFTDSEIIVADEGHLLDRALTDDFSVKLSSEMVSTMASKGYERPKLAVLSDEWCKYANDGEWVCKTASEEFSGPCVEKTKWDNWMMVFSRLYLLGLADEEWPKWISQDDEDGGVQFVPLWPEYIHQAFFSIGRTQKLVIMSASILDPKKFAEMYGLVETDYEYIDLPWVFSKTHRPIHYRPVAKVTERNLGKALKPLAQAIRYIMDKYAGEKGIIHTRSFKLLQLLQIELEGDKRLIFQSKGIPRGIVINFFRRSTEPRWLVSPSVWYGEDFPYESASVQVICKVPYGDLGNFLIKARSIDKSRPWWYSFSTVQDLVQVLGRVVRAEDDYGESIILDAKFTDLYEKYWEFFPEGLREAIDDGGVITKR